MVLREFLVAITYQVNNYRAFSSSMTLATAGFGGLSKAALAAGATVGAVVGKMSDDLDKLYFVTQRTKASADNLVAFGYAARQTGSSAEAMGAAVENVASRLRRLPGLGQMLGNMGIDSRGDPTKIIQQLYQRLSNRPEWVQLQYADLFGIDEKTWLSLKNMGEYVADRQAIAKAMGLDMDKAAKSANTLWTQLRRLGTAVEAITAKAVDSLGTRYAKSFENFTNMIIRNGDRIAKTVEFLVDVFLKFVEAIGLVLKAFANMGDRLYEWFDRLDPAIQKTILGLGGLLIAWRLLSAGIMSTPLGRILAIATGLVLLLEDYMVWKERGKGDNGSEFDWSWVDDNVFSKIGDMMRSAGEYARAGWQWLIDIVEWFRTSSIGRSIIPQAGQPQPGDGQWDRYGRAMQGQSMWERSGGLGGIVRRLFGISPAGAAPAGGGQGAQDMDRVFQELGYSPAQRAALLATASRESSFNPQADIIDSNGERSYGLFQHNGPRLRAMMAFYGVTDPRQITAEMQARYLHYEMTRGGERGRSGRFFGATTPGDATRAMTEDIIRPADRFGAEGRRRAEDAARWMQRLQAPTGGVAPGSVPLSQSGGGLGGGNVTLAPTAYINVTTPDASSAARQVLAGQDQLHQLAIRNLRQRVT